MMLLLHHFNVFGYNSTSIVMFVCFYCYLFSAVILVTYLLLLFFSHLSFCNCKGNTAEKSLVFAARQIPNNLSPIAKKIVTLFFCLSQIIIRKNV